MRSATGTGHDIRKPGSPPDLLMAPRRDDRRIERPFLFGARVATARLRMRPAFFIVGAMKSGTSSLFGHLCRCEGVAPPFRKETHYLTAGLRAGRSPDWYRAHFPLRLQARAGRITGEATPDYCYEHGTAEAIRALNPDARIVFLLRDPVERAISHYFHEVRMGRETLPIEDAIRLEAARMEAARDAGPAGIETLLHACYAARGRYHEQVARYLSVFPKDQVLVVGARWLFERPAECVARVADFLGLSPPDEGEPFRVRNRGTNRSDVPEEVRRRLADHLEPHNEALWKLLGHRLDW
jgi:hypothetical protein